MDIDLTPVQVSQEHHHSQSEQNANSESTMNFDYLQGLHDNCSGLASNMDTAPSTSMRSTPTTISHGQVDESKALDRPINLNERFVTILDQLDARVEKFRKDALNLQEKKDYLLMSMDLIKSNDLMQNMSESEREEIICYIERVSVRLNTVDLSVRTVRDKSQEDSLSQINVLIDQMIKMGDPVVSRQRCQQYLNACCSSMENACDSSLNETYNSGIEMDTDVGPVDKKFEGALLGCTLDDQKNIKKRLQALMGYLNKQTIRN